MTHLDHRTALVGGCRISVWEGGRGRPLLFLHGSQGIPKPPAVLEELCRSFRVIAPEHPGFGRSDAPGWLANIHDVAYFYLDLLAQFDLRHVHVVGQALGGWIAVEAAVRSAERLASLTIAGAPGLRLPRVAPVDVFAKSDAELLPYLFHRRELAATALAALCAADADQRKLQDKNRRTLARLARRPFFHDPHLHKWLHRITLPTLVLWGAQDRAVPIDIGRAYHAAIPASRMVSLDACGHLPHVEQPAAYLDALTGFIDGRP